VHINPTVQDSLPSCFAACACAFVSGRTATGQIDQRILQHGFAAEPHWAVTDDEPTYIMGGEAVDAGTGQRDDINIFHWDSTGRIKLDREESDPEFWLGYRAMTIAIEGDFSQITGDLNDVALVGAFALNERGHADSWRIDFAAGAGTANDGHWSNTDAIYGIGAINASQQLDQDSFLHVGISYQGNRVLFPDVPLPYISYIQKVDESLSYELGVLRNAVLWDVTDGLRIEASYLTATTLAATITADVSNQWSVFFEYKDTIDGFYQNDRGNGRVFYERSQVAAGVQFDLGTSTTVRLGGGWAFHQDFATGFDIRGTDSILRPDDAALFFLTLRGTF
jgi:hypothetical protein